MLKSSFSAILILTLCVACVGRAAVLQDDINAYALWHGDTIVGTSSPDDAALSGRTAIPLIINGGAAPVTLSAGQYGSALDFGTNGRQMGSTGTTWPLNTAINDAPGNEIKVDGWFYVPNVAALPIPTTAGGSGSNGGAMYMVQVSSSAASGTRGHLSINAYTNTGLNLGQARLTWQKTNNGQTFNMPFYSYRLSTGLACPPSDTNAIDLTGKWLHIVAYAQYSNVAVPWDPNFNRVRLEVTDPGTATTYAYQGANTGYLTGTGNAVWVGMVSGKSGCNPYRGFRGKIDELKLSKRVHDPMVAYAPTPANNSTIGPNANLPVSWVKAAPFNPADIVRQDVWMGPYATFSKTDPNWTKVATDLTGNTANLGSVTFGNSYYWVVDSNDSGTLVRTASAVWKFSVDDIAPTINVGADQLTYLVGGTRTLSFAPTVVDPDTNLSLLTYQWTQLAGPAATISAPTSKDTDITFTAVGSYYFQATVDDGTFSGSDIVRVQVFSTPCAAAQAGPLFVFQSTDFDENCKVNFADFATLAANWSMCNSLDPACL